MKAIALLIFYAVGFLSFAYYCGRTGFFHYIPQYPFDQDPFFQVLKSHPSRGLIVTNNVQMHRGINLQVVTNKQYFMPRKVIIRDDKFFYDLHCVGDESQGLANYSLTIGYCFRSRAKQEWIAIGKILGVSLVMTERSIELPELKLIARNEDFNLYEISL